MTVTVLSYQIRIRKNETGEVRTSTRPFEWDDGSLWYVTEGNFGCDCNRERELLRAGGVAEDDLPWPDCSTGRFTIIDALLPDGTVMPIDEAEG